MLSFFIKLSKFNFVNFPIKSKYYHKVLPTQINDVIRMIKKQNVLNEKCFLLEHLSDLMYKDRKIVVSPDHRKIITQQLNKWLNGNDRFQHISTVAWIIKRLNLQKIHSQLCSQIKERFLNDEWYVNFDESVKALDVFKDMPDGEQKQIILSKIERNIGITMWNVNMKYYARIASGLLEAGRFKSQLWERMEHQVLQNLGMQYDTKTLCDIFKAYALSHNGSNVFYQMVEKVLFQGHFDQYNVLNFKNLPKQYDDSGEFFSIVIETYAIAAKTCGVVLTPDFKDYVYQALKDRKTEYKELRALSRTIRSLEHFELQEEQIREIEEVLLSKKPVNFTLGEVRQFYELMYARHGKIPQEIHQFLQNSIMKDIRNKFIAPCELVDFVNYLIQNKAFLVDQSKFIEEVNNFLENNFKYLYAQQAKYVIEAINQIKSLELEKQPLLKLPQSTKGKAKRDLSEI